MVVFKKKKEHFSLNKDVLIFSSGPSLNYLEEYKYMFTDDFYKKYIIIVVKQAKFYFDKHNLKYDIFVHNFISSGKNVKIKKNINNNYISYCSYISKSDKILSENCNNKIKIITTDQQMDCISNNNKNCLEFKYNKEIGIGHIMLELAIPAALKYKPNNIYILGWDICPNKKYKHFELFTTHTKPFKNNGAQNKDAVIHLRQLYIYLLKHYNIKTYKLNYDSCVSLPYYSIKKL